MKNKFFFTFLILVTAVFIITILPGKTAVLPPEALTAAAWTTLPGPTGSSVADIVLSPAYPSPQTLFAGLRGQGVYRSDDGAYTWSATGSGDWIVHDLAISPAFASDDTLFALTGDWATGYTVQRTENGGQTWQAAAPATFPAARRLAISPNFAADQLLYLATGSSGVTYLSTDGGSNFTQATGWFASHTVNALIFSPDYANDNTLFALVAADGIYRSTDSGATWTAVATSQPYSALAISPDYASDQTLAAVSAAGTIFISTNDGLSWTAGSGGILGTGGQTSLAFSPTFAADHVIMAASSTDASPLRSTDGGATWEAAGPYDPASTFRDGMIGGDVYALALAPNQVWDGVQFAATSSGVARSPYRGDDWMQMNKGLPRLSLRSAALAPGNPQIMLAGTEFYETRYVDSGAAFPGDGNVQWSLDGGQTWRHVTGRLARVNGVVFSPDFGNDETAFAVSGMIGQHSLVYGGVYRSQDNSATWTAVYTPTFHAFQTVAISPDYANDQTVWASAVSYSSAVGLFQSTDGGDSWSNIAPGVNISQLVVSPNYAIDPILYAGMSDGVYRSDVGGAVWVRVLDVPMVTALAISPAYGASRTVYAAARPDAASPTAVYRSTDGGNSWQELATGIPAEQNSQPLKVATLQFAVDGSVLAGVQYGETGGETAVYRSADGGNTWQIIDSLPAASVYDLTSTPTGSFDIFAATDAGLQQTTIHQGEAAEPGAWRSSGPKGGKGDTLAVSPDFANDGVAFSGEAYTSYSGGESGSGIVKSTDFGQNWAVSAAGTEAYPYTTAIHDYALSPNFAADQTVFAATWGGLMQSVDGGQSWARNEALYSGPPGAVTSVAVAPDFPASGHMMAAAGYGGFYVSADGGLTWNAPLGSGLIADIAYSPDFANDQTAFTAAHNGIQKTEDAGITWTGVFSEGVHTIAASPDFATDQTVFAASNALHLSTDGGATWITRTIAPEVTTVWALAVSPQFATDGVLFAGTGAGLFYTNDAGQTWTAVPGYEGDGISSLAISPAWPGHPVLLVGTSKGVYRLLTADLSNGELKQAAEGFAVLDTTVLAQSPDESILLTGARNRGVYLTADDGHSWLSVGLQGGYGYYSISALAVSPDYDVDETIFAAWASNTSIGSNLHRTQDGGATWETVYSHDFIGSVALSPDFAADHTVFATGNQGHIQKSTSSGDNGSWTQLGTWPPAGESASALHLALPPDYPGNGRILVGSNEGFWYSADNGATWQQAATGLVDGYYLTSLQVSPNYAADHTLLAAASWSDAFYNQYSGVFRSTDGGVNWSNVSTGIPAAAVVEDAAFSPDFGTDQTAYLITRTELYRSLDGGSSWTPVGSPPGTPTLYHVLVRSSSVAVSSKAGVWQYGSAAQDIIVNGRFESNDAWILPATPIPAAYSSQVVYNGGRSMRVGLDDGLHVNGFSSVRQIFTLPADPLLARLTFHLYPVTGEETAVPAPPLSPDIFLRKHENGAPASSRPASKDAGAPFTGQMDGGTAVLDGDAQYAYLYSYDYDTDTIAYLTTLYWDLSNAQAWQTHTVNLSAYGGQDLLLLFGAMNDGLNGMTGMYVDDVSLLVIDGSLYPHRVYLPIIRH